MTTQPWQINVLIPARDEEVLLPRCLRSVLLAIAALPRSVTTGIVVVADSCTDRTYQIASSLLGKRGSVLTTRMGAAGSARAIAATFALRRQGAPLQRTWLANTDADCVIPPTWLVDQLRFAHQGVEAVAGTVSVDNFDEHGPEVRDRFRDSYRIDPDGSHPHIHGANLGVRADAYLNVGGWANLQTAEDHDLWDRLKRVGARLVSTASIEVATSGRRVGRAPSGFAAALAAHNSSPA